MNNIEEILKQLNKYVAIYDIKTFDDRISLEEFIAYLQLILNNK